MTGHGLELGGMGFLETFRDLLRLLDNRGLAIAFGLVTLLALSGAIEIAGIFVLFGYIASLGGSTGQAAPGPVTGIFSSLSGRLSETEFALVAGMLMVAVFAAKNALSLLSSFAQLRFAMKRYEHVAGGLFDGYQDMPLELVRVRGTLEPTQVLNSVITVFRNSFTPLLQLGADAAIVLAMLVALMIAIQPDLVIGSGLILGLTAAIFLYVSKQMSDSLGLRLMKAERSLFSVTGEALRGLIEVRLSGQQSVMRQRFSSVAGEFGLANRRLHALQLIPRALNEMVLATGIVIVATWFAAGEGGLAGKLPTLAILGFAGLRVTAATSRITQSLQQIGQSGPARRRMMESIERTAPHLLRDGDALTALRHETYRKEDLPLPAGSSESCAQAIRLEHVSFTYPNGNLPVVEDVSLDIPAGSFIGFCGQSGSGKSTLALLVMGLLRPQQGRITCDGWDVQRHISAWHRQIGYVGQTPFMSTRSVRENVAFGMRAEQIDDAAVWRALEAAAIADLFRTHPDRLDAMLGEDGGLLSGGQRQRVAIARALYRDPTVLVFDEATAALDTATEREVTAAISRLRGGRTVIAIAHRLSTIETADAIHLVESGKIEASGTYGELLKGVKQFRMLAGSST